MLETKKELLPFQFGGSGTLKDKAPGVARMGISPGCARHLETLQALQAEKQYEIFLPSNPQTDYVASNSDGTITRIAATPSINGVQWPIPAEQTVKVPKSIYEQVKHAMYQPETLSSEQQRQILTGQCLYSR